MTDTPKVLGQDTPGASLTTLYTVPGATATIVSKLVVCNIAAAAKTFRVAIRPGGAAIANKMYQYYDTALPANDSLELLQGVALATTDVVSIYGSDANVAFTLTGDEIT
jgi:hypothetical protein